MSEEERRRLAELDQQLSRDDPELAHKLTSGEAPPASEAAGDWRIALLGGMLLILGILDQEIVPGALGAALITLGVYRLHRKQSQQKPGR